MNILRINVLDVQRAKEIFLPVGRGWVGGQLLLVCDSAMLQQISLEAATLAAVLDTEPALILDEVTEAGYRFHGDEELRRWFWTVKP